MVKVLIPTNPDDTHAIFVKLALEKNGHRADLWYTADIPIKQTHSFEIIDNKIKWATKGTCNVISDCNYDVIWYRRPSKPVMSDSLHSDDVENSRKENMMFYQAIWQTIFPTATWINPVNAITRVNSKLLQLQIASNIGLKVPKTLISNDPSDIKSYIKDNLKNIVYKTLYPMAWLNKKDMRLTYTNEITLNDLPSDEILQSTPGIFQEKIEKEYELRITYFGDNYIAVKIYSQENTKSAIDWRYAPTNELKLEQVSLPEKINQYCQELMKKFNIVFGCFDFIVTPNNDYYFLEVNEQGQFLWIEDVNPNIKMLQAFVDFLISYDYTNENKPNSNLSLSDFQKDVEIIKMHAMKEHVNPPNL